MRLAWIVALLALARGAPLGNFADRMVNGGAYPFGSDGVLPWTAPWRLPNDATHLQYTVFPATNGIYATSGGVGITYDNARSALSWLTLSH